MEKNTKFDGDWENGEFRVIIKGNKYVSLYNGFRYGKGVIEFINENLVLTSTHAHWKFFIWFPFVEEVRGKYTLINGEITISNIEGRYVDYNGIWKCTKKGH